MNEIEIKGFKFKIGKLNVFKQLSIARRLGPLLGEIFEVAPKLSSKKRTSSLFLKKISSR